MISKTILYLFFVMFVSVGLIGVGKFNQYADQLLEAEKDSKSIPVISIIFTNLDMNSAYNIQKDYIIKKSKNDKIAGFKAGLTSRKTQEKFNIHSPVSGVLFSSGKQDSPYLIDSSKFQQLMIDTELGYIFGKPITSKLNNVSELKEYIKAVMPVIELPDFGFGDANKLKTIDIVAANASSRFFILGKPIELDKINPDNVKVVLNLNVEIANQGRGSDLKDGQWNTLLWLVNNVIDQGWEIEPGQVLITGALGNIVKAKKGQYIATFSGLGQISFKIQ